MTEQSKLLISYCFLAALTETKNDLYQGVFIPIIKRTLSFYSLNGGEYGNDTDIQKQLQTLYGIDVPLIVIRQLLKAVEKGMSRKEHGNSGFKTLENGRCFEIEKYTFLALEEKYKEGSRNAQAIQAAFESYLKDQQIDEPLTFNFADFLTKNRSKLTAFFRGQPISKEDGIEKTFIHHVNFLETIEQNHHQLFKIAESLYLGSIVASLFECEFDYGAKFSTDEIYYLDTQIVLKALDLQGEADTRPIQELITLIKESGAKIKILDITAGEINYNLDLAVSNYNNTNPTTTINEACLRRNKNKTWLISFSGNLEKNLSDVLNADIEIISTPLKEKFQKSADVKELQGSRMKKANAEHDVFAYLFVREKRGGSLKIHQKAKVWFLTANKNLLSFNIIKANVGNVPEVTLPDTLATLLWLKNPNKLTREIKSIGLNELIATTLNDEIASRELINEFDSNIKAIDNVNQDDYQILISSVAYQSAKYIERLNHLVIDGKTDEFSVEAHKLVEKERKRRASIQESIRQKSLLSKEKIQENESLKTTLKSLEKQIKISNETGIQTQSELEKLADLVSNQNKYIKRLTVWILITIAICGLLYLNINFSLFFDKTKIFVTGILGLGGLWSFGSFIINLIKAMKKPLIK